MVGRDFWGFNTNSLHISFDSLCSLRMTESVCSLAQDDSAPYVHIVGNGAIALKISDFQGTPFPRRSEKQTRLYILRLQWFHHLRSG